jgi:hypothetical protein
VLHAEGKDKFVVGWDVQQPMLAKLSRSRPWQRRKPQITWRGRHGPGRDQLRYLRIALVCLAADRVNLLHVVQGKRCSLCG